MRNDKKNIFSSNYNRWYTETRYHLFHNLSTMEISECLYRGSIPKIQDKIAKSVITKLSLKKRIDSVLSGNSKLFVHTAPQYFTRITTFQPHFWNERDGEKLSVSVKVFNVAPENQKAICALLNSNLFYLWFLILSDCRAIESIQNGTNSAVAGQIRMVQRVNGREVESCLSTDKIKDDNTFDIRKYYDNNGQYIAPKSKSYKDGQTPVSVPSNVGAALQARRTSGGRD